MLVGAIIGLMAIGGAMYAIKKTADREEKQREELALKLMEIAEQELDRMNSTINMVSDEERVKIIEENKKWREVCKKFNFYK